MENVYYLFMYFSVFGTLYMYLINNTIVIMQVHTCIVQGGSDNSGILKIFVENLTAQLKIIQFNKTKKQLTEGHIENQDI
jgi:hypothetical protein